MVFSSLEVISEIFGPNQHRELIFWTPKHPQRLPHHGSFTIGNKASVTLILNRHVSSANF